MNDLSTSKPSRSQNTVGSLPWGTFLFLLAVFILSTPLFRFNAPNSLDFTDTFVVSNVLQRDNWARIFALISLGAFALFNFRRIKLGRFQINGLLGWLILFYLVWAALSITWSIEPKFTAKRVGILLLLSLGALYVAERFSLQETIALVLFICAVTLSVGLYYTLLFDNFHPSSPVWRFGGNMHAIGQGWNCGLLLLSAIALSKTDEKNRAVYIGIAIIALLFLILTRSRMALIACIMGSAVYWGLASSKRHVGVLFFLGIIIGGSLMYFLLGDLLFMQYSEKVITLGRGEWGMQSMSTLTGRVPLWKALMGLVDQRPFLGYGYDAFITGQNLDWVAKKVAWATPKPHSGYMAILGGLGYIGAVPFVLILILSVSMSIRLAKRNSEYAFIVAGLVWLIFNLYTEDSLLSRPYFPTFVWMILLARLGFIREKR